MKASCTWQPRCLLGRAQRTASVQLRSPMLRERRVSCPAAPEKLTGLVFEPLNEVQVELETVNKTDESEVSFARCGFHPECEAALNEQINVEYNVSYVYHALYAYFDRDNVGLPGMAKFFKESSDEERNHAELLMKYQNMRGGRVQMGSIVVPDSEFNHESKGEALYAMELALALEKMNFLKLRALHDVAAKHNDMQMTDFIEGELLEDQVNDIKEIGVHVSQLRRIGKGHGVYHFDLNLQ